MTAARCVTRAELGDLRVSIRLSAFRFLFRRFPLFLHPLSLAYLITDLEVGGVPLHLFRLATALPRDRFRVRVISLAGEGPVGGMLRETGIPVWACRARSVADLAALWRLWRFLRADPPDIVHSLLFHANTAARLVGPMAGVPISRILCEIQTAEVERGWHLILDGLTCRLCACEIGNSPSVVEHLHREAHIPRSRLACEWGAVEVAKYADALPLAREALGLGSDQQVLIWTGRLDPVKGFEEMLAACALVRERHGIKLVLVGEGPYRPVVERLIRQHGLSGDVLMLGRRTDVPRLLKTADVFLFCSRTEGLPNALLEAMAAGLPIVATDVPGCRDLIVHGRTGLLAAKGRPDEIAANLAVLLADADLARRLGLEARRWVGLNADASRLALRWEDRYTAIVGGVGPRSLGRRGLDMLKPNEASELRA